MTGAKAAETLRQTGFDGRVLVLGAERERPFHTDGTVIQGPARRPLERKSPFPSDAPLAAGGDN